MFSFKRDHVVYKKAALFVPPSIARYFTWPFTVKVIIASYVCHCNSLYVMSNDMIGLLL